MMRTGPERRRSTRFDLDLPLQVVRVSDRMVNLPAKTHNVSSVGALFAVQDDEVSEGDRIEFLLTMKGPLLPKGSPPVKLRCRGRVVRASEQGRGSRVAATIDRYQFERD